VVDIEFDGRLTVLRPLLLHARPQRAKRVRPVGRLPTQMLQVCREKYGMLTRAAADLEHRGGAGERLTQDAKDRSLVTLAGFRVLDHSRCQRSAESSNTPTRREHPGRENRKLIPGRPICP